MDYKEYSEKRHEILERNKLELQELTSLYALSNNEVEVGDIVIDRCQTLLVDKIQTTLMTRTNKPSCVYSGVVLRKDLRPREDGKRSQVYQINLREVKKNAK